MAAALAGLVAGSLAAALGGGISGAAVFGVVAAGAAVGVAAGGVAVPVAAGAAAAGAGSRVASKAHPAAEGGAIPPRLVRHRMGELEACLGRRPADDGRHEVLGALEHDVEERTALVASERHAIFGDQPDFVASGVAPQAKVRSAYRTEAGHDGEGVPDRRCADGGDADRTVGRRMQTRADRERPAGIEEPVGVAASFVSFPSCMVARARRKCRACRLPVVSSAIVF